MLSLNPLTTHYYILLFTLHYTFPPYLSTTMNTLDFFLPYWQLSHNLLSPMLLAFLAHQIYRHQRLKRLVALRHGKQTTWWTRYGLTTSMGICLFFSLRLTYEVYIKFVKALHTGHYHTPFLDDAWWELALFSLFALWIFWGILPAWLRYLRVHGITGVVQQFRHVHAWIYLLFALIAIGLVSECLYAWWLIATA